MALDLPSYLLGKSKSGGGGGDSYTKAEIDGFLEEKQDINQYSTMPTASEDYEGKIIQYVGTTTQDYTNGYFYLCEENSGSYVWTNINVQNADASDDVILITKDNKNDPALISKLNEEWQLAKQSKNYKQIYLLGEISNYVYTEVPIRFTSSGSPTLHSDLVYTGLYDGNGQKFVYYTVLANESSGNITGLGNIIRNFTYYADLTGTILTTTSNVNFTPTRDNNPVNKKYVDQTHYQNIVDYDATKTQVLKNVQGVLTWVDE